MTKVWDIVRQNFGTAANLDPAPSVPALKRRIKVIVEAKQKDLQIYKSGDDEQYNEIDQLLEEYISLLEANNVDIRPFI